MIATEPHDCLSRERRSVNQDDKLEKFTNRDHMIQFLILSPVKSPLTVNLSSECEAAFRFHSNTTKKEKSVFNTSMLVHTQTLLFSLKHKSHDDFTLKLQ